MMAFSGIRVLHVVGGMGYGGVSLMLRTYYRNLDRSQLQFDFVTHQGVEDYHAELIQMGARVFYLKTMGSIGLLAYMRSIYRLIQAHGPYRAVHIHTNYQAGIVALAARLAGVRLRICHIRGTWIDANNARWLPIYRALMIANCPQLLACSQEAGRHYYGYRRFTVIPNAVDLALFTGQKAIGLRDQLDLGADDLVIGHVGRFTVEKNHAFLPAILAALAEDAGRRAVLVLAGDGPLRPELEQRFAAMGRSRQVRFLGTRTDIPDLMGLFDVLLLPSRSEGLPNVIVQAQASGLPCVMAAHLSREVDLGLGLIAYAPLEDPKAWARAVRGAATIERPPRAHVVQRIRDAGFEIHASIAKLLALYQEQPPTAS
jgi:glycosyltransferase EpsF